MLATLQSLKNKRRRYPRSHEERIKFTVSPRPLTSTKDATSPTKTSKIHQKRLRTTHLQSKSTARPREMSNYFSVAPRGGEADIEVISAPPPAARRRTRASTADTRSIITATGPDRQAAIPSNKNADNIPVSVDREMQTADNSSSKMSEYLEIAKVCLQQQKSETNTADMQTLLESAKSTIKCRVMTTASTKKIKETIASAEVCQT